jgi:hypothetical protein
VERSQQISAEVFVAHPGSPGKFHGELNFSRVRRCRAQQSSQGIHGSGCIKDVTFAAAEVRNAKVGVIQDVEQFCPELHIEIFKSA